MLGSSVHRDFPGKNARVGCHALLLGIFPTQGSNPGLPHCKQILYHLSHQGSTRILECSSTPHPQLLLMKEVWLLNEGSSDSVAAPQGSTPGETVLMLCCSGQGRESRNQGILLSIWIPQNTPSSRAFSKVTHVGSSTHGISKNTVDHTEDILNFVFRS